MKKFYLGIFIVLYGFIITGCKSEEENVDTLNVYEIEKGEEKISIKEDIEQVLKALGDDYEYSESKSCMYDGYDKLYEYSELIINTYPENDKDYVLSMGIISSDIKNFWGTTIGDSKETVLKKMEDDPVVETDALISYEIGEYGVSYYLENNSVKEIEIYILN